MEMTPEFIINGCKLYKRDLENQKKNLVMQRNDMIERYYNWIRGSYEHFRIHNQNNELDEEELFTLCNIVKEHFYTEYDPKFKELDGKIKEVSDYLMKKESESDKEAN